MRLAVFVALITVTAPFVSAEESPSLVPLNTLATGTFASFQGGLYPHGRNEPWGAHAEALTRATAAIVPLNREGEPDANGKIVVVGIGASVCRQIFEALEELAPHVDNKSPTVVFVNLGLGGQDVNKISDASGRYWKQAIATLEKHDLSPAQVQVAWYQSDDLRDQRSDFPGRPQRLKDQIADNLRLLKQSFPNTRLCYQSARHTTAFSNASSSKGDKSKHAEPRPYQYGWAVKWLIEEQTAGREDWKFEGSEATMPLVSWATYFWTSGDEPRDDGYRWTRDDVVADGVHLSEPGQQRVAHELLRFFANDAFTSRWFLASGAKSPAATSPTLTSTPGRVMTKSDDPSDPAWIVNGKNKIPKLQRLLGTIDHVRAVVYDLDGKPITEIIDLFSKRTKLNTVVGKGNYRIKFFDKDGKPITLTQEVGEDLLLK